MRQTSGIIINNDFFINSSHVVKMEKGSDNTIRIYMSGDTEPTKLVFDSEQDRNVIFNKIIMELYGHNYSLVNF